MVRVRLEVLAGLSGTLGNTGLAPVVFNEEAEEGATVGDIIRNRAAEHQAFRAAIIDASTKQPSGQVTVVLNDRLIEALKGLDTTVKEGDIIRLFPIVAGG